MDPDPDAAERYRARGVGALADLPTIPLSELLAMYVLSQMGIRVDHPHTQRLDEAVRHVLDQLSEFDLDRRIEFHRTVEETMDLNYTLHRMHEDSRET